MVWEVKPSLGVVSKVKPSPRLISLLKSPMLKTLIYFIPTDSISLLLYCLAWNWFAFLSFPTREVLPNSPGMFQNTQLEWGFWIQTYYCFQFSPRASLKYIQEYFCKAIAVNFMRIYQFGLVIKLCMECYSLKCFLTRYASFDTQTHTHKHILICNYLS